MNESNKQAYQQHVEESAPRSSLIKNCIWAFLVGGGICLLAQICFDAFLANGVDERLASTYTSMIFIFIGAFLSGLGIYDRIGNHAGAGTSIPITGFANSIASAAIEFKKEGFILGVGSKIFLIAGPVILYGIIASAAVGLAYYYLG